MTRRDKLQKITEKAVHLFVYSIERLW